MLHVSEVLPEGACRMSLKCSRKEHVACRRGAAGRCVAEVAAEACAHRWVASKAHASRWVAAEAHVAEAAAEAHVAEAAAEAHVVAELLPKRTHVAELLMSRAALLLTSRLKAVPHAQIADAEVLLGGTSSRFLLHMHWGRGCVSLKLHVAEAACRCMSLSMHAALSLSLTMTLLLQAVAWRRVAAEAHAAEGWGTAEAPIACR
jgi:hypothetical protein